MTFDARTLNWKLCSRTDLATANNPSIAMLAAQFAAQFNRVISEHGVHACRCGLTPVFTLQASDHLSRDHNLLVGRSNRGDVGIRRYKSDVDPIGIFVGDGRSQFLLSIGQRRGVAVCIRSSQAATDLQMIDRPADE